MTLKTSLPTVRYFGPGDVYHYLVDNRPLHDLRLDVERTCDAVDSEVAANQLNTMAAGFLVRAIATSNTAIGKLTYHGNMTLSLEHSILSAETVVSVDDTRYYPKVGMQEDELLMAFTAPSTADTARPWVLKGRVVAVSDLSFYDGGLTDIDSMLRLGQVEYALIQGDDQAVGPSYTYPSVGAGWTEILRVLTYTGTEQVQPYMVEYVHFRDDGALGGVGGFEQFSLEKYKYTMASDTDTVTGVPVNCNYAMVFVDGLLQPDVTVIDASTVQFPSALHTGQIVDFVVTAGGLADLSGAASSRYVFTATDTDQTHFNNPAMDFTTDNALVFINGVFLPWTEYSFVDDGATLVLSTGVSPGTVVVVMELRAVGVGLPHIPGGVSGNVLVKTGPSDTDYMWGPGSVGIDGGVEGDILVKTGPDAGDLVWQRHAEHGTVRLEFQSATDTVKLFPHGGGGIYVGGVVRVIPTSGVECVQFTDSGWRSTAVANGFQDAMVWMGLTYNPVSNVFTLAPYKCALYDLAFDNYGVPTLDGYPNVTVVGACRLIGGADRVLPKRDSRNLLVRSFFNDFNTLAMYTSEASLTTSSWWSQLAGGTTESSGVSWNQPPAATLLSAGSLRFQVSALVLPGESIDTSLVGAYEGLNPGLPTYQSTVRLCPTGVKCAVDSSTGHSWQPRNVFPSASQGSVCIRGVSSVPYSTILPTAYFLLPEVDLRTGCSFRLGSYQTMLQVIR